MRKLLALAILVALSLPAQARHHGFRCGATVKALTGSTCGSNLARAWAVNCPHTTLHAGAVIVFSRRGHALGGGPGGHVAVVVSVRDECHAKVRDEKGTYERDVCRNQIAVVEP